MLESYHARRNLSPEQRAEVLRQMKTTAKAMKAEKKTQGTIETLLGVAQSTVSAWLDIHNIGADIVHKYDCRQRVTPAQSDDIAARVSKGETQASVAADMKLAQSTIRHLTLSICLPDMRATLATASRVLGCGNVSTTFGRPLPCILPDSTRRTFASAA